MILINAAVIPELLSLFLSVRLRMLLCIFLFQVSGCTQWRMMPAPVAYETGAADPFARMEAEDKRGTIEILYATDRAPAASTNPAKQYGKERGIKLLLGQARIRLGPKDIEWQELESQSRSSNRLVMELLELDEFGPLWTTIPLRDKSFREAWYGNSWVNQDVINLLRSDASPEERGLIRSDANSIWTFPDDYPTKTRALVPP